MDQSHSQDQLWGAVEIIPNRLYYAPLNFYPPEQTVDNDARSRGPKPCPKRKIHYFSIDSTLVYWAFFLDFGPLNLGMLYRFCAMLNHKLVAPEFKENVICFYSGAKGDQRANAVYLICAWSMLYLGRGVEEAYNGFLEGGWKMEGNVSLPPRRGGSGVDSNEVGLRLSVSSTNDSASIGDEIPFAGIHPLPPFHDASPILCTYDLTVYDCLRGLDKARQFGFFKFGNTPNNVRQQASTLPEVQPNHPDTFNIEEYEYYEAVENGDLNWILQNKILAFAGPQSQKVITPEGHYNLTPSDYIPYFLTKNVKLVIRLNKNCYDAKDFEKVGIRHAHHYFLDGSCPTMQILHSVLSDMESVGPDEAMAIHCKAGLGRTGCCIGAYLMKHYRLSAREVIGWMRICRPGMVIGPQQHFLQDIEHLMIQAGEVYRTKLVANSSLATFANSKIGAEGAAESTHPSNMRTPQSKGTHAHKHVNIVTPDAVGGSNDGTSADKDLPTLTLSQRHSTLSSTMSSPTTALEDQEEQGETSCATGGSVAKEGDQADSLLSRKLRQNFNQFLS